MEFREYLKGRLLDFLLIQAGITLAIGVIGLMGEPEKQIRPLIMFVPFLYAFFCACIVCHVFVERNKRRGNGGQKSLFSLS